MNLQKATSFALVCVSIGLAISLIQWLVSSFELLNFEGVIWLYRAFWLFGDLLLMVPLIVFFYVLGQKQKGQ